MTWSSRSVGLIFLLLASSTRAQQVPPPPPVPILPLDSIDPSNPSLSRAINAGGLVTGLARISAHPRHIHPHAVLWVPLAQGFQMQDLGTLPRGRWSEGRAINSNGQVVGHSETIDDPAEDRPGGGCIHAFVWTNGQMQDLGTLGGETSSAGGINTLGQVVGASSVAPGPNAIVNPGPPNVHAALWTPGHNGYGVQDLGLLPGGANSAAFAINATGQVAGVADDEVASGGIPGGGCIHAVVWLNGLIQDLGTLGGENSAALAINDSLQVAGGSQVGPRRQSFHAFLWDQGGMRDLGTLGGEESYATGINNLGQVIGVSQTSNGAIHAFLWFQGQMQDLGGLGGDLNIALGINDSGRVAGGSSVPGAGQFQAGRALFTKLLDGTETAFFRSVTGLKVESDAEDIEEGGFRRTSLKRQGEPLHGLVWETVPPSTGQGNLPPRTHP